MMLAAVAYLTQNSLYQLTNVTTVTILRFLTKTLTKIATESGVSPAIYVGGTLRAQKWLKASPDVQNAIMMLVAAVYLNLLRIIPPIVSLSRLLNKIKVCNAPKVTSLRNSNRVVTDAMCVKRELGAENST